MKNNLLPPNVRKPAYTIFALLGVVIGGTQVGFAAAELGQPTFLTVALAVYAFVGGALGLTAADNTDTTTAGDLPGDWSGADSDDVIPVDEDDEGFEDDHVDDLPAVTDEEIATEADDTPVAEDYEPRH